MSKILKAIETVAALDTRLKRVGLFATLRPEKEDDAHISATLWVQDNVDFHVIAYSVWYDIKTIDTWVEAQAKLYLQMFNAAESNEQEKGAA